MLHWICNEKIHYNGILLAAILWGCVLSRGINADPAWSAILHVELIETVPGGT